MNQYLLGLLAEAETEQLDEQSVADDEFAARLADAENDLIDAYVNDELSGDNLEHFESHYLASPLRRERVRFAMALREATEPAEAVAEPGIKEPAQRNWLAELFAIPALQWGLAVAVLVIFVVAGWLVADNLRLRRQLAQSQAKQNESAQRERDLRAELENQRSTAKQNEQQLAQLRPEHQTQVQQPKPTDAGLIATLFLTPQLRGAGQLPSVKIEPTTKSLAAHLTLEPNDFPAYRVSLIDQATHQTLWTSGALRARANGGKQTLSVSIRSQLLKSPAYSLRVSGISANGTIELISDYPFKVVK
jgi:hypothetical protein